MPDRWQKHRAETTRILMLLVFALLAVRLFDLQCLQHPSLNWLASNQQKARFPVLSRRGTIFDTNFRTLAASLEVQSVYAEPCNIADKKHTAEELAAALKLDPVGLTRLFKEKSSRKFVWVKRKVDRTEAEAVPRLGLQGIGLRKEFKRLYPMGSLACHVIGFCDIDERGLEGIELAFDQSLTGKPGYQIVEQDGHRHKLVTAQSISQPPQQGKTIVLTLDSVIQHIVEAEIPEIVTTWDPVSVTSMVMRPTTGEVLALANWPGFDLNSFSTTPAEHRLNRAVAAGYEPGSTFKPFLAAALLEEGLAGMDDRVFCHHGNYKVPGIRRTIRDVHAYGWLNFQEVVIKSSNIGMTKLSARLSASAMRGYVRRFGFGRRTGIELPGEIPGQVTPAGLWSRYTRTSVPYGYEVLVTPIQLLAAFNVFANRGLWVRPRIVKGYIDAGGNLVTPREIQLSTVTSSAVADRMLDPILTGVVNEGTGKRARLSEYQIAGKTGTTKKAGPGGYSASRYVSSFVCCAPAENPRISVLVMVNEPRRGGSHYGGTVAAPSAARIVKATLDYLAAKEGKQRHDSRQLVWSESIDRYH